MQTGELVVTGISKLHIQLQDLPISFKAYLKDSDSIPCNPGSSDKLTFKLDKRKKGKLKEYYLHLQWEVTGVKTIVWEVHY